MTEITESEALAEEKHRKVIEEQRIAREKKEAEEMAETERINDEKHRRAVHKAIYLALYETGDVGLNAYSAKAATKAIRDGKIPHVKIIY